MWSLTIIAIAIAIGIGIVIDIIGIRTSRTSGWSCIRAVHHGYCAGRI